MAVQAGRIASWQLSPASTMRPPEVVAPEASIQHPLPRSSRPLKAPRTNLFAHDLLIRWRYVAAYRRNHLRTYDNVTDW
jgi:hypothetical protein